MSACHLFYLVVLLFNRRSDPESYYHLSLARQLMNAMSYIYLVDLAFSMDYGFRVCLVV